MIYYVYNNYTNYPKEVPEVGAIAVSKKEEQQIERLQKELRIPTKSELVRVALRTLEEKTAEERLRQEIQQSVQRLCQS